MSQLFTAQFIWDSGFLTWLTPTVTITEAKTWTVRGNFALSDVLTALGVINVGVQKASKLIPHSTDI